MSPLTTLAAGLLTLGLASARQCTKLVVLADLTARNGVFNLSTPMTDIEVTNFILNSVQNGHNGTAEALTGYDSVSGNYSLSATFCQPDDMSGENAKTVQLLTHGIGFDRSYWDISYQYPDYSYVARAVDEYGYCTFAWDRLGIGLSQHGDPISEIQAPLEEEALIALTEMLRAGTVPNVPNAFDKVVHIGHSFGSVLTFALSRDRPELTDAIILQGFSPSAMYFPYFLLGGNFVSVTGTPLSSMYEAGWFAAGNPSAVQTNFFAPNHFDTNILPFAFQNGQPVSAGELLTIAGAGSGVSNTTSPVFIITGMRDLPFCGGDCTTNGTTNIPQMASATLPNAQPLSVQLIEDAGHALNLDINHENVYYAMNDWLKGVTAGGFVKRGRYMGR